MILAGDVTFNNERYCFAIKTTKSQRIYYAYSTVSVTDKQDDDKLLLSYRDLAKVDPDKYLLGVYSVSRTTGAVKQWGDGDLIRIVLDNISYAENYTFEKEHIVDSYEEAQEIGFVKYFGAKDNNLDFVRKSVDGELIYMYLVRGIISLELTEFKFKPAGKNIKLEDAIRDEARQVLTATIKTIRRSDLDNVLDMSWYHSGDTVFKNYSNAKSIYEFETKVFTPIVKYAIEAHKTGEPAIVSLDTETTGLNTYNLSKDNLDRSHCVSIQLAWEDNQGVAIFNDMEHFQNVSLEYTLSRLKELFEWYEGERQITYWDTGDVATGVSGCDVSDSPQKMTFDDSQPANSAVETNNVSQTQTLDSFPKKTVTVKRDWFFLVGHNFPFDRRTCYQTNKTSIWFNADTRQMAFDINPQIVRGTTKLKVLTRRLFGHETPELTDILGKGNEDKYKYLVDEEVANIYGCADVDYTRKLFFVLRDMMPNSMWKYYLKQDVDLPNILAISEFYGMMTKEKEVIELADKVERDIEILKEAAYSYVGAYQDYTHQRTMIEVAYNSGSITEEEYEARLSRIKVDPNATYHFEFKASSIRNVLYEILKYPIKGYTSGKDKLPSVDKNAMKRLLREKRKENSTARKLEQDIISCAIDRHEYNILKEKSPKKAKEFTLLSAEEFNKKEYPMALLLQKYAELNKEFTSYYKPIKNDNMEGKLFKGYNMARIETRRISNPGQTMKANLKALIRSYSDDYYVLDFDMSQIEYRIMLSKSGFTSLIEKMKNPERDYHTETASMVYAKPAHKVAKKERKNSKSVSFGVPYGLGDSSLCETMHGEVNQDNLVSTRVTLAKWKANNKPIVDMLEESRAEAMKEWEISDKLRDFFDAWEKDPETKQYVLDENGNKIPTRLTRVTNQLGFYRVFNAKDVGQTPADVARRASGKFTPEESSIRRKAGNYPIQSFAAEIFRVILTRFYWRCVKEGIEDKIMWHMLIHDELLSSVHKSLHPFYIFKLVKESCMITMKGHTKYFVGINIGDTWQECKDDAREAPVFFVDRMIAKWDAGDFAPEKTPAKYLKNGDPAQGYWFDHPWEFIEPYRKQYVQDRIGEVIRDIIDIENGPIDVPVLLERFDNYTVRAYVNDYPTNGEVDKERFRIPAAGDDVYDDAKYDDAVWSKRLETWALAQFGEGKEFINSEGEEYCLTKYEADSTKTELDDVFATIDDLDDFDERAIELNDEEEDEYWSFDDEQLGMTFESDNSYVEEEYDLCNELDFSVTDAKSVNDLLYKAPSYKSFHIYREQLRVPYITNVQLKKLKDFLAPFSCSTGYLVIFKDPMGSLHQWLRITDKVDLAMLDKRIAEIQQEEERRIGCL